MVGEAIYFDNPGKNRSHDVQGFSLLAIRTSSVVRDLTNEDLPDPEAPMSRIINSLCCVDILLVFPGRRVGQVVEIAVEIQLGLQSVRYPIHVRI